jgi:hypothetical protein
VRKDLLEILQHSLGVDQYGRGRMYRNHYCGGAEQCRLLVDLGYMIEHTPSELTGGSPLFTVTSAGRRAMLEACPKPPKLTRSQIRYRDFLREDCGESFGEWLKWRHGKRVAV